MSAVAEVVLTAAQVLIRAEVIYRPVPLRRLHGAAEASAYVSDNHLLSLDLRHLRLWFVTKHALKRFACN